MRNISKIFLAALMLAFAAPAAAETEMDKYFAAGKRFEALQAEAAKKGALPRLSDPAVAETLAIISNKSGTFGSAAFPMNKEAMDRDVCGVANKVQAAYGMSLLGLEALVKEKKVPPKDDPDSIANIMHELMNRNLITYQDEIFPLLAFGANCFSASLPLLIDFVAKLPSEQMTEIRRQGIVKGRNGVNELVTGAMAILLEPRYSEENKIIQLKSALRNLPVLSGMLTLKDRAQLIVNIEATLPTIPKAHQAEVAELAKVLSDQKCEGLCKY
jgi:hypothetical protein